MFSDLFEVGVRLGYLFGSQTSVDSLYDDMYEDFSPDDDASIDEAETFQQTVEMYPWKTGEFVVEGSVTYPVSDKAQLLFDGGVRLGSKTFEDSVYYSDVQLSQERHTRGAGVEITRDVSRETGNLNGEVGYTVCTAMLRYILEPIEGTTIAFGLTYSGSTWDYTLGRIGTVIDTLMYDDGDAEENDGDDYTTVTREVVNYTHESVLGTTFFALPVAVEFPIHKKVDLRLGAKYSWSKLKKDVTESVTFETPSYSRTEYGDGTVYESVDDYEETSSHYINEEYESGVNFTFGLGYKPNDNLQVDVMGFSNLVNLSGWRVSVVLLFD